MREKKESQYGLWLLARSLDTNGDGILDFELLETEAILLWGYHKFRRVFRQTRNFGWLRPFKRKADRKQAVGILSLEKLALQFEDVFPLSLPRLVDIETIATLSLWRATLLKVFHASRSSTKNPISRKTLEALTDISPRHQQRHEETVGIEKRRNYHQTDIEEVPGLVKEMQVSQPGTFAFTRKPGILGPKKKYITHQKPNSYYAYLERGNKNTTRRTNARLEKAIYGDVGTKRSCGQYGRLFYPTRDAAEQGLRKASKNSVYNSGGVPSGFSNIPNTVFYRDFSSKIGGFWKCLNPLTPYDADLHESLAL